MVKEIKLRKLSMQELDAIALALRFNAPILPIKHLDKAGIYLKANPGTQQRLKKLMTYCLIQKPLVVREENQSGSTYSKAQLARIECVRPSRVT
jgi:bifunctional DNase/RNase